MVTSEVLTSRVMKKRGRDAQNTNNYIILRDDKRWSERKYNYLGNDL